MSLSKLTANNSCGISAEFEREARINAFSWSFAAYVAIVWFLTAVFDKTEDVVTIRISQSARPAVVRWQGSGGGHGGTPAIGKIPRRRRKGMFSEAAKAREAAKRAAAQERVRLAAERKKAAAQKQENQRTQRRAEEARRVAQEAERVARIEKAAYERKLAREAERKKQEAARAREAQEAAAAREKEREEQERRERAAAEKTAPEAVEKHPAVKPVKKELETVANEAEEEPETVDAAEIVEPDEESAEDGDGETGGTGASGEEVVFDGSAGELSRDGVALMNAIGRVWRPPRGVHHSLRARVKVVVRRDGSVDDVVIEQKSGVLAYDMAARAALWRAEYPSAFWGKSVVVVFGGT